MQSIVNILIRNNIFFAIVRESSQGTRLLRRCICIILWRCENHPCSPSPAFQLPSRPREVVLHSCIHRVSSSPSQGVGWNAPLQQEQRRIYLVQDRETAQFNPPTAVISTQHPPFGDLGDSPTVSPHGLCMRTVKGSG